MVVLVPWKPVVVIWLDLVRHALVWVCWLFADGGKESICALHASGAEYAALESLGESSGIFA